MREHRVRLFKNSEVNDAACKAQFSVNISCQTGDRWVYFSSYLTEVFSLIIKQTVIEEYTECELIYAKPHIDFSAPITGA